MTTKEKVKDGPTQEELDRFPPVPRRDGNIVHVFWVVFHDYRALTENECRNVVYPAKAVGYMERAPKNEKGVFINRKGDNSSCRFVLTDAGLAYYKASVKPLIHEGFKSEAACPRIRRMSTNLSTSELKLREKVGQL